MQQPKIRLTITAVVLLIIAFLAYQIPAVLRFHVTGTNPKTGQVAAISPFFKINFNKPLKNSFVVDAHPYNIKTAKVTGKTLELDLYPMAADQVYTITLKRAESTGGAVITNKIFRFTAKDLLAQDLPADQQKAILANQDAYPASGSDPILKHLPYGTLDFKLSASYSGQQLISEADLLLSQADVNTDKNTAISQYKAEVKNYIRSLGLDPAKYKINYKVIAP